MQEILIVIMKVQELREPPSVKFCGKHNRFTQLFIARFLAGQFGPFGTGRGHAAIPVVSARFGRDLAFTLNR